MIYEDFSQLGKRRSDMTELGFVIARLKDGFVVKMRMEISQVLASEHIADNPSLLRTHGTTRHRTPLGPILDPWWDPKSVLPERRRHGKRRLGTTVQKFTEKIFHAFPLIFFILFRESIVSDIGIFIDRWPTSGLADTRGSSELGSARIHRLLRAISSIVGQARSGQALSIILKHNREKY
ncbi:hypothetical protein WN48_02927 [Eufriesea mexicana]|nr:hypothetical protein WN48_02927 [Eufriesea mexicana]